MSRGQCLIGLAFAGLSVAAVGAQSAGPKTATVNLVGDALHVRAPGFTFLKGEPLARLKDGRSVQFEFEVAVLARPGGTSAAQVKPRVIVSYDLWEERFAVTLTAASAGEGAGARSISHLTLAEAEAWCLDRAVVPIRMMGRLAHDEPFWIRLAYRVIEEPSPSGAGDDGFTLHGLIDRLSRRNRADEQQTIEAGPFRLSKA